MMTTKTEMLHEKITNNLDMGILDGITIPDYIPTNLNPNFLIRDYQEEAIKRLIFYIEKYKNKEIPVHLLFNMATGSGKTLIMASNLLYFYKLGYRHFLFFVNSTNIVEKTKENFLNPHSSKYLFNEKVIIDHKEIPIRAVHNFDESIDEGINIVFTTIHGLHYRLNAPSENALTYEDFSDKKIVLISDEAHHLNALTKKKLTKVEEENRNTWEYTVNQVLYANPHNVLLEYTATAQLENEAIRTKYQDRILYRYSLREFRQQGYSKEVKVLKSDQPTKERILQSLVVSQLRKKIAENNGIVLKPVILIKSNKIQQSENIYKEFDEWMHLLSPNDLSFLLQSEPDTVIEKAYQYFQANDIQLEHLVQELKIDFSEEKRLIVNNENDTEEKQLLLNSLEDRDNPIRIIFAVNKLNEGWDVLNLFDIVRVDETRGSKSTTTQEAQLIGRGARYFPFAIEPHHERYKRKYDDQFQNENRILEELYYHSINDSKYISDLTIQLKESGILPNQVKELKMNVKPSFKKSSFWSTGMVFTNRRIKNKRESIRSLKDMGLTSLTYSYRMPSRRLEEISIFNEETQDVVNEERKFLKLSEVNPSIIRTACQNYLFYRFNRLRSYFPYLRSLHEFMTSTQFMGSIEVELRGMKQEIAELTPEQLLNVCLYVCEKLEKDILANSVEYEGTKEFYAKPIKKVVEDRIIRVSDGGEIKEFGISMNDANNGLQMDLSQKEWYIYDDFYGTSEEKELIHLINTLYDELKPNFRHLYLLRNEKLFQLYRFHDGQAFEPDFVLFAQKKEEEDMVSYQLFIEPKNEKLMIAEPEKEQFLLEIQEMYKPMAENQNGLIRLEKEQYQIVGIPFYNKKLTERLVREKIIEHLS